MSPEPAAGRTLAAALLALALSPGLVGGCGEKAGQASPAALLQASREYQSGRFEAAWVTAREVERSSSGLVREEAAYIGGLAAARSGRLRDAEASLRLAAASSDADLANRASRSLSVLRGAGNAASSSPSPLSVSAGDARSGGGFSVQAGAYASEANARRRAEEISPLLRRQGLGEARVEPVVASDGRSLWAVRIGRFANRLEAGGARSRLGHPEWSIESVAR
jgi:cell division septation protein DedD